MKYKLHDKLTYSENRVSGRIQNWKKKKVIEILFFLKKNASGDIFRVIVATIFTQWSFWTKKKQTWLLIEKDTLYV